LMLDLGANVDCHAEHLLQFAVMGSVLFQQVTGTVAPRVGLLNIGSEEIKGNELVKAAGSLLRASHLNFIGNVEGSDIYGGQCDVVVCDGFVGNVALKTSEGLAAMIRNELRHMYSGSLYGRLAYLINRPILQKLCRRLALSFGHIAHFERGSFYDHFFRDLQGKGAFLEETLA